MRSQFDGLHTILGNSGVAVPQVDAPAVEEPPDDASLRVDDDLFASVNARPARPPVSSRPTQPELVKTPDAERSVSGWAAAAVMAVGLIVGGSAAMALFHDDVSHILGSLR